MAGRGGKQRGQKSTITSMARELGVDFAEARGAQKVSLSPVLFPPLYAKPLPLVLENDNLKVEDYEYMVALKQEFITSLQEAGYRSDSDSESKGSIERYTDRFRKRPQKQFEIDYARLPKELRPVQKKTKLRVKSKLKDTEAVLSKLDELEKKEQVSTSSDTKPEVKAESDSEESDDDAVVSRKKKLIIEDDEEKGEEEEDDEEFNDYCDNYFDPGDEYLEDSEDNPDDAAVF